MALIFFTASNGLVTRRSSQNPPPYTPSGDRWRSVDLILPPYPQVGDAFNDDTEEFTSNKTALTEAKAEKIADFRDLCAVHAMKGYFIAAVLELGDPQNQPYWIPSDRDTQKNLSDACNKAMIWKADRLAAIIDQTTIPPEPMSSIWCAKGNDLPTVTDWARREMPVDVLCRASTAQQTHIQNSLDEMAARAEEILACTTVAQVDAVEWQVPPD